jgi:hypothetical protein
MSGSVVNYKGYGSLVDDTYLQVWLRLLADEIDGDTNKDEWLEEVRERWYVQTIEPHNGTVFTYLDAFASSEEKRERILDIAERAYQKLQKRTTITEYDLNEEWNIGGATTTFYTDLDVQPFLDVAALFMKLLKEDVSGDSRIVEDLTYSGKRTARQ